MDGNTYTRMYQTGTKSPKFLWTTKSTQKGHPYRLIVSSRGSDKYRVAKEVARIFKPLRAKSTHHVTQDPGLCRTHQEHHLRGRGMHYLL